MSAEPVPVNTPPKHQVLMEKVARQSPNGKVQVLLTCRCGAQTTTVLWNDDDHGGPHTAMFDEPEGWHVELAEISRGGDRGQAVVRCPEHRQIV